MTNFESKLAAILAEESSAIEPHNDLDSDPQLQKQQKDAADKSVNSADNQGKDKIGDKANNQAGDQNNSQNSVDPKQAENAKQLGLKMADFDKQIVQLQAKIQGGAAKPTEINKLNQLLTAKKSVQDQFMRLYGVNPSG